MGPLAVIALLEDAEDPLRTMPRNSQAKPVRRARRRTRQIALAVLPIFIALLPVPWLASTTHNPPGMAWRLDGRLQFDGEPIDPPGVWVGLTAGRPPVVAELLWSWVDPDQERSRDMRTGSTFHTPAFAEPAAIAIGLAHAGRLIDLSMIVEARQPLATGLLDRVSVSTVNGHAIVSQDDWADSIAALGDLNEFVAGDGHVYRFSGSTFPYEIVEMMDAPIDIEVSLAGWGQLIPLGWYRKLALGNSHGLLLGLAAYSQASGEDLARGRVIGGTGALRRDGTVDPVGGLPAKTRAATRAGVDLLVYPADQRCTVEEAMDPASGMVAAPVASLSEAISVLRGDGSIPIDDLRQCGP